MDGIERKLREIVTDCLPSCIRLDSLELSHGALLEGQPPKQKILVYALEVPGPEPDPAWFMKLVRRVGDLLGHDDFYLGMQEPPRPCSPDPAGRGARPTPALVALETREAELRQVVEGCLPRSVRLEGIELTEASLAPGRPPVPEIRLYTIEAPGAPADPRWFLELDQRVADYLGFEEFSLIVLEPVPTPPM
jgi:hypothetical protein